MSQEELDNITYEIFKNKEAAEYAFKAALELGYKPDEINVIMAEDYRKTYYPKAPDAEEEAAKNLAIGGAIGALIALGTNFSLLGLGLVMIGPLLGV